VNAAKHCEWNKRFNTEGREERRRAQREKERSFGRLEAKVPPSG
jgi:hypothetical protein